jgi:hypothetical protein
MKIMKLSIVATLVFASSLLGVNITFPQSAKASIPCEAGTIRNYSNGSVSSCMLRVDMNAALNNNVYYCKQGNRISFDDKGRFTSCVLSTSVQLRNGNELKTCEADYPVYVSIAEDGSQSINCYEKMASMNY